MRDRRSSDRVLDDSLLLVSGYDLSGFPFSETTKINDVSQKGISFLLRTLVETGVLLDVRICSPGSQEEIPFQMFGVKARVLRISKSKDKDNQYRIAAQFEGEFVRLGAGIEPKDVIRELEEAVEFDERMRYRS